MAKKAAEPDALPTVTTVAMGETEDGHFAALVLTTQGDKVTGRELLAVSPEAGPAEAAWRDAAYARFFTMQEPTALERVAVATGVSPYKGTDVALAHGLGLAKHKSTWALVEVHTDGTTVTECTVVETSTDRLYLWERLDVLASRRLLGHDRRAA